MGKRRPSIPRLLEVLNRGTLLRLAKEYSVALPPGYASKAAVVETLISHDQVDADEILRDMLTVKEARSACVRLKVARSGGHYQLVLRLSRILGWRPFHEAREFVRQRQLRSKTEWELWRKGELRSRPPFPEDIPASPRITYRDAGWRGWGDWLGTGTIPTQQRKYRDFAAARRFARGLHFESTDQWRELARAGELPDDVPANPHRVYVERGWRGYGDWLGLDTRRPHSWRPFSEARAFARSLGLTDEAEWQAYCRGEMPTKPKLPRDVPKAPQHVYRGKGFKGFMDWLGTRRKTRSGA